MKLNLMNEMQQADSLSLLSDNETLSNYTRRKLIPLFHFYDGSKKAKILKYLTKSKEKDNFLLAEELLGENYKDINRCDLATIELISYYNQNSKCSYNTELSQINWNKIYEDDQIYRRLFDKYSNNPRKLDSVAHLAIKQDSLNRKLIKFLIKKHTLNKILDYDCDCSASKSIFFIAQHSDRDVNFRKEVMDNILKLNSYPLDNIAYLIDRQLMNENKKQKFGTQLKFNVDTNKFGSYPIEDMKNIDSLRYEYNLPKLSVYLKYANKLR